MTDFQIIEPAPGSDPRSIEGSTPRPTLPLPSPGLDFDVRPGTAADIPWLDALRKANSNGLGFASFGELEGHLEKGHVHVAVAAGGGVTRDKSKGTSPPQPEGSPAPPSHLSLDPCHGDLADPRIGYCIAADRYYMNDQCGNVYQMCIDERYRRSHVGANLLKKVWETWPRGVKLCGCWCAQDLEEANAYWEKCGFTAVGFRAGSRTRCKGEPGVHIYWQKRIRSGDLETPFWYPKQTQGGAMKEARIVFPVPPGSSWRDAKPAVYPGIDELFEKIAAEREAMEKQTLLQLAPPKGSVPKLNKAEREAAKAQRDAKRQQNQERTQSAAGNGGLRLGWNAAPIEAVPSEEEVRARAKAQKQRLREAKQQARAAAKKAAKQHRSKNDPLLVAAARDLRDRWMEAVQQDPQLLSPPEGDTAGYDVSRQLEDTPSVKRVENVKRLAA